MKATAKPEGFLLNSLEDIETVNVLTDRVRMRKQAWLDAKPQICADWSHLATLSWQETEGQHIYIRRARLFDRICRELPITIFDGKLIVGTQTRYTRGANLCLTWSTKAGEDILAEKTVGGRSEVVKLASVQDQYAVIEQDVAFWRGKTVDDLITKAIEEKFGSDYRDKVAVGVSYLRIGADMPIWSRCADYEKVLKKGLRGIIKEVEERREAITFENSGDGDRWDFL